MRPTGRRAALPVWFQAGQLLRRQRPQLVGHELRRPPRQAGEEPGGVGQPQGVVAEDDLVAFDEQLDTEYASTTERFGNLHRDIPRFFDSDV